MPSFERRLCATLTARLQEPRRFLQVVAGPRQVGKTTLVRQTLRALALPSLYASADEPSLRDVAWLEAKWQEARDLARQSDSGGILVLDEIQKAPHWSEVVKRLWDEDSVHGLPLQVVILGSAPLLMQQGLSESLAGRFEVLRLTHWSYCEMQEAFGFSLEDFLLFGGYPGAAALVHDESRWRAYLQDSLIETTLSRDILLMTRVLKPALLRQLFDLACRYSGQILSYTKMLGQLQDAGNTTTLAHYLSLLQGAGLVSGLQKHTGQAVRQRASSPKLQVWNTGLLTAQSGLCKNKILADCVARGRLIESAVGAHLLNSAVADGFEVYYWRQGNHEVDFVVKSPQGLIGIEVKSAATRPEARRGLETFRQAMKPARLLIIGRDGIALEDFLKKSPLEYLGS